MNITSARGSAMRGISNGLRQSSRRLETNAVAATLVFLTSIVISLGFYVVVPSNLENDQGTDYATYYEPVARNLLAGRGYVQSADAREISVRYPPGFSLQIASSLWVAQVLNISEKSSLLITALIAMGLTSVLVFSLARSVWNMRMGLIAALIWLTYPLALWMVNGQNGEVPFQLALYAALYVTWRIVAQKKRASPGACLLAGALAGVAMLIRPIAIGICIVIAAVIWFGVRELSLRRRIVLISALALGNLLAVAPWEVFVYARTGKVVVLATGGVVSLRDGLAFAINTKGYRQGVEMPEDVQELMRDVLADYDQLQTLGDIGAVVGRQLRERPVALAKLFAIKAARSWYATDTNRRENQVVLLQLIYLGLIAWGSFAAWEAGGVTRQFAFMVWLVSCYFWGMNILSTTLARYAVPIMGLLFLLIPAGLTRADLLRSPEATLSDGSPGADVPPPV